MSGSLQAPQLLDHDQDACTHKRAFLHAQAAQLQTAGTEKLQSGKLGCWPCNCHICFVVIIMHMKTITLMLPNGMMRNHSNERMV